MSVQLYINIVAVFAVCFFVLTIVVAVQFTLCIACAIVVSFSKNDLLTMHVIAIGNAFAGTDSAQSMACSHFLELLHCPL